MDRKLIQYYPDFIKQYREFKALAETEQVELEQIDYQMSKVLNNAFIDTADEIGLKRFEKIVRLPAMQGETLEDKRIRILAKWTEQLPYTYRSLENFLITCLGKENFLLQLNKEKYELKLLIKNYNNQGMRSTVDQTKQMIPANFVFRPIGNYFDSYQEDIKTSSQICFNASFFPRKNKKVLYLDGIWLLDGKMFLNGYNSEVIDFYPTKIYFKYPINKTINISTGQSATQSLQILIDTKVMERFNSSLQCLLHFQNVIENKTEVTLQEKIESIIKNLSNSKIKTEEKSTLKSKSIATNQTKINNTHSFLANGKINQTTNSKLVCEKNWWHLNGECSLNGSKLLNAEKIYVDIENTF